MNLYFKCCIFRYVPKYHESVHSFSLVRLCCSETPASDAGEKFADAHQRWSSVHWGVSVGGRRNGPFLVFIFVF